MSRKKKTAASTAPDVGRQPLPKAKILVIDDDPFITGIYTLTLVHEGFQVELAPNGLEGIAQARKSPPDIIILDIVMPEMDGFETLERLKQDSKLKGVPVVMLSGLSQNEDIDRAIGLGAVAYLRKTQTLPTDCLGKIREVLKI